MIISIWEVIYDYFLFEQNECSSSLDKSKTHNSITIIIALLEQHPIHHREIEILH